MVYEIVLHNEKHELGQLRHLVSETWDCCLLDCGASKTICGELWLDKFTNSLTEDQKGDIKNYHSKSLYRFGYGEQVQASRGISIPPVISNTKVQTDLLPYSCQNHS